MRYILLTIVIFVIVSGLNLTGEDKLFSQEGVMTQDDSEDNKLLINKNPYADFQRTSYLPVKGRLTNSKIQNVLLFNIEQYNPVHLALYKDLLIIQHENGISVINKNSRLLLWTQNFYPSYQSKVIFNMDENGLYTYRRRYLRHFDYSNKEIEKYSIHTISDLFLRLFFLKTSESIIYSFQEFPHFEAAMGKLRYVFRRYGPGGIFEMPVPGTALGITITRDLDRFYIVTGKEIHIFPFDIQTEDEVAVLPFSHIITFSLDHKNRLMLVEKKVNHFELKQIDNNGKPVWVVKIPSVWLPEKHKFNIYSDLIQPPSSSPDGYVYFAGGNILYCIKDGKMVWNYEFQCAPEAIRVSILADNSVLASAGNSLLQISSQGKLLKSVHNPHKIISRPIMDTNGKVYFANEQGVKSVK